MDRVLVILLAGGAGERLAPLTTSEPKPMMPFGGIYRLIDVTLSNCVNSGLTKVFVVTQHKALSLNRHIREAWNILSPELGQFIEALPPTRRLRDTWYLGTADAVYQNIQSIEEEDPEYTLILSADHIYKMDYRHILDWHIQHGADVTVGTTEVALGEASRFGIMNVGKSHNIYAFEEKPQHAQPKCSCVTPATCAASMGVYLFSTNVLLKTLLEDAEDDSSGHDFGHDVLPRLIGRRRVVAYNVIDENKTEIRYWRDVGTLDSYYEANMDLVSVTPLFNLYDQEWPIRTAPSRHPPAKFVFAEEEGRMGLALNSLIAHGCIISGGRVVASVLSSGVKIDSYSTVENSVVFANVTVGPYCRIRRTIIAQNIRVPEFSVIGINPDDDRKAGHFVTDSGLVVLHQDSPGVGHITAGRTHARTAEAEA